MIVLSKKTGFYEDVVMAGFGGQGLMFIGKLLAFSAMKEGRNVTWIPSYGPEMRGGVANCNVVISDGEIGSPVPPHPRAAIVMNNPSLDTFEPKLKADGLLLVNSSFVTEPVKRKDVRAICVAANEAAVEAGNEKAANMVMLGAYVAKTHAVSKESIIAGLKELFANKVDVLDANVKAFEAGLKCKAI
jgi:2-oxoglutarate ferredoxin oxidoreductase subunit gamma